MVSIGGNIRPHVGDSAIQNINGTPSISVPASGLLIGDASGAVAGGVGGANLSGHVLNQRDGFIPFSVSGQTVWLAYWVSA